MCVYLVNLSEEADLLQLYRQVEQEEKGRMLLVMRKLRIQTEVENDAFSMRVTVELLIDQVKMIMVTMMIMMMTLTPPPMTTW